jgi:ATP-dependent DNA ligase
MISSILYKYTTKKQIQQWQIFVSDNAYWTEEGIHNITKSDPTICIGKNIGKKNETSPKQQALLEAQSKYQKKLDRGYNKILTVEKKFFEPMLAHDFEKYEKLLFTVPTFIQPKLDGVRCYLNDKTLMTRSGKPIVSCPHLELNFFGLDGELYHPDLKANFNKIISLTRKTKPEIADLEESKKLIQYWIYDYPYHVDKVFSERYSRLKHDFKNFPDVFKLVPTYEIKSLNEMKLFHENFISQGYEGSIIRLDLGGYENKRSKQLLKYKDWQDAEWEIIDILEGSGNRANCANMVVIKLDSGIICKPTMTGTEEFMQKVWKNKKDVIGKQVTVKYFGFTEDGSLRFPTVKNIIDYV